MQRYFALERLEFWLGMIAFLGLSSLMCCLA
jgi:hypothetical protein